MAGFSRVSGDANVVVNFDANVNQSNSTNFTNSVGLPVQPQGPKLNFVYGNLGVNITNSAFSTNGAVEKILGIIQQNWATIYMYQFDANAATTQYRIAYYPTSVLASSTIWGNGANLTLEAAIRALGTVSGVDLSGATASDGSLI